jgi:hypothetical protein
MAMSGSLNKGQYDLAILFFNAAFEINPNNEVYYSNSGKGLLLKRRL